MEGPLEIVERLARAVNDHDLEALVGSFAEDYENETPAHPVRGFRGREQVRRNWEQMFAFVTGLRAEVGRAALDGDTAWSEWELTGTRRDGSPHHVRGVVIFGVRDGLIRWARFYLEPVDLGAGTVDDAVREQVVR
ncbi:MAG: nuclear transport factor 2 family protein [Solirubrobacterales bacterium]|nr:nuclear transport factor 2 family protein [Solirubrobacterales bacterium]MBV9716856.1 nuclear transport factor 2 family protein [Solirubrobacterales bacterium]